MASSRALLYLYLAVVAASGQLCERNSQCDMAGGEWCGSHESCGDEDCCISSVPCDVTTSSAHSCLACSREFDVTFVITEDCVCLNAELSVDECSDAFARGTPREVADDDDDDDDDEEEYDAEWTWTAGLMSCYGAALAVAAHAARLRWAAADAAAAGAKRAAAAGGKRRVDTTTTTGVRALLMLVIAVGHMNAFGGAGRVAGHMGFRGELGGGAAVEGFFLVSGFVMALAYSRQDFVGSGPGDVVALARRRNFYAKRFARLAPLYYLSELLMCLLRMDPWGLALLPFSLTGITSWTLIIYPNNGVLWSVSTIAFFYYRLPWLFGRLEAWTRAHLPWLAALMAVKWVLVHVDPFFYMPLRVWPPFVVPVFMIGAIVGRSRLEDALAGGDPSPALWGRRADALSVALALFVGVSAFFSHYAGAFGLRVVLEAFIILPLAYWIEALTYAGSASWVGFFLSARRRPAAAACFREIVPRRFSERSRPRVGTRPLQKLGDWSYAVYCFHMIVIEHAPMDLRWYACVAAFVGASAAIAEAVERPLVRWLTARALLALPPDGSRRAKPPCCCHGDCPTCRLCGGCVRDESAVALSCPCYVPADECVVWNLFAFWNCTCGSELAECRVHRHAAWAPLADAAEDAAVVAAEPAAEAARQEPA